METRKILRKKRVQPFGLSWYTNMAAVSLFWNTNMAAVTLCKNTLLSVSTYVADIYAILFEQKKAFS